MPETRVYADTSVFGGMLDREFAFASARFFEEVASGRFQLVISALVQLELVPAPAEVRSLFTQHEQAAITCAVSAEAVALQEAYLSAGVVGEASATDALHVALATTAGCSVLVSWNFKHIVHRDKAPRYNAVNTLRGLPTIGIYSPQEVISYGRGSEMR